MRNFFLSICCGSIWSILVLEFILMILMYRSYSKNKKKIMLYTAILTTGLFIDALGISLGNIISGAPLLFISRIRFLAHGLLIPLLLPISAEGLKLNNKWMKIVWAITIALMVAGLAEASATKLEICQIAGVTRYKSSDATPAWASAISSVLSFGTVIPQMIAGIIAWIKKRSPFLFLSGFSMFAFSALGPATGNTDLIFFISMFGELLMVYFLYLFSKRLK